jgi:hypothetical protein
MTKFLVFFALSGLLLAEQVMAAPAGYACPSELPAASLKVEGAPTGWATFVGAPLYLSDAAPADGPPERLGILRGEDGKVSKTSWTRKYSVEGRYPDGKWLRCDYGAYGEVSLAKRLPDDVKECIVTGRKGPHAGESKFEITCR